MLKCSANRGDGREIILYNLPGGASEPAVWLQLLDQQSLFTHLFTFLGQCIGKRVGCIADERLDDLQAGRQAVDTRLGQQQTPDTRSGKQRNRAELAFTGVVLEEATERAK